MNKIIEPTEIVEQGERLLRAGAAPGTLREWYEATLEERTRRRNTIHAGTSGKIIIEVGHTYDLVIIDHSGKKQTHLRGWELTGRAGWSDTIIRLRKPFPEHPSYGGASRELHPERILSAIEVTA